MSEVPVILLEHLSEAQRRALVIADNQLALNSGWDEELLRIELAMLQEEQYDLNIIGFDDNELARLLADQDAAEGLTDEDAVPELAETPVSVAGRSLDIGRSPATLRRRHRSLGCEPAHGRRHSGPCFLAIRPTTSTTRATPRIA